MAGSSTAEKPKRKRAKQVLIKEVEDERIKELDNAIDARAEIVEERAALTAKLVTANAKVGELLEKHDLKTYRHNDYVAAFVEGEPELKIQKIKEPKAEKAAK